MEETHSPPLMTSSSPSSFPATPATPGSWTVAVHLTDSDFTSRIDLTHAYVLPSLTATTSSSTAPSLSSPSPPVVTPTATLASPWLLTQPQTSSAAIETVPLAWRCPSCGSFEVEQLYWRRPPRFTVTHGDAERTPLPPTAASAAALRTACARRLRLQGLSAKMKAKLERHRRRRERREEMRWRSHRVDARCRQCFLCPRCAGCYTSGGRGDDVVSLLSAVALDIRITPDMRYYIICPCCQWQGYQSFPSMELLIAYMDNGMGEDKAEVMREWRAAQRSATNALRSRMQDVLHFSNGAAVEGQDTQALDPPPTTVSQAAWATYRRATSSVATQRPQPQPTEFHSQETAGEPQLSALHPAVALEELRKREVARRAAAPVDVQSVGVPPCAVQAIRVVELAQDAWTHFTRPSVVTDASDGAFQWSPSSLTSRLGPLDGRNDDGVAASVSSVEVAMIAQTQRSTMGLRGEAVDTRLLTLHEWMQRYRPAAVVAQQRKAAAAAAANASPYSPSRGTPHTTASVLYSGSPSLRPYLPPTLYNRTPAKVHAAATPMKPLYTTPAATATATATDALPVSSASPVAVSALYHTPTSAYLQSILQHQPDRALNLPAYCVPRGRKEMLTGLVWRLPPSPARTDEEEGDASPRVVVLDRPGMADEDAAKVYTHWTQVLEKRAERHGDVAGGETHRQGDSARAAEEGRSDSEDDVVETLLAADRSTASSAVASTTCLVPSVQRRKTASTSSLPPPLFLDGSDFAAVGALPYWRYVGHAITSESGGEGRNIKVGKCLTWRFRLVNLGPQHDLCLTKLALHDTSLHGAMWQLALSSSSETPVQLPLLLQSQWSAAERAMLGTEAGPTPPLPTGTLAVHEVPRVRDVTVLLSVPLAELGAVSQDCDGCSVYVALRMEVFTPLPDVATLKKCTGAATPTAAETAAGTFTYHVVSCGVTLLLSST